MKVRMKKTTVLSIMAVLSVLIFYVPPAEAVGVATAVTFKAIAEIVSNHPPLAAEDFVTTTMNTPIESNVLTNDFDPDGDPLSVALNGTSPANGVVTLNSDGFFTYMPNEGFVGTDTFTYIATDGELYTEPVTVTIIVTNTLPTPGNDTATTDQDVAIVIDVLANDSDPDGDPLAVYSFTYEGAGTVVLNEDGTFTYTPAAGFVGEDCFTYSVSDGEIGTEPIQATVIITVKSMILTVFVDIKPKSCPNPFNVKSKGVLPGAILGTEDFDVSSVDVGSVHLEGVAPIRFDYEDVATPFHGELCDCHEAGPDGILDLVLHFDTQEVVDALGSVVDGEELVLTLIGNTVDGNPIEGYDCVRIIKKGKD